MREGSGSVPGREGSRRRPGWWLLRLTEAQGTLLSHCEVRQAEAGRVLSAPWRSRALDAPTPALVTVTLHPLCPPSHCPPARLPIFQHLHPAHAVPSAWKTLPALFYLPPIHPVSCHPLKEAFLKSPQYPPSDSLFPSSSAALGVPPNIQSSLTEHPLCADRHRGTGSGSEQTGSPGFQELTS